LNINIKITFFKHYIKILILHTGYFVVKQRFHLFLFITFRSFSLSIICFICKLTACIVFIRMVAARKGQWDSRICFLFHNFSIALAAIISMEKNVVNEL